MPTTPEQLFIDCTTTIQKLEAWLLALKTHVESAILTGLVSNAVAVVFATPFEELPEGIGKIYCYRVVEGFNSNVIIENIVVTTDGFSLDIDAEETDLTGIILEYNFQERTV
jgi:hypothetical protein